MSKPIVISFFSGAGGLDMGIHNAGFDVKLCCEIEKKYCDTLINNHPDWNVKNGDIMEYDKERIYEEANLNANCEIDLVIGGSPCQSFSTAGKRQAFSDPRGKAMIKYAEIVEQLQPKAFILENVKGLLSAAIKHRPLKERGNNFPPLEPDEMPGSALQYILNKFPSYKINKDILNAALYGVAQKRERVFLVGIRKDLNKTFIFPEQTHASIASGTVKKWITFEDIINDLKNKVEVHDYVNYSPERLKYMKMIPQGGGNWRDLPESVRRDAMGGAYESGGGKVGFYRRIKLNEPAPTLLTSPMQKSTNLGHPLEDRPLSIQEYLAIQGFPIDYNISGTLNDKYTQIGNAVPVKLAEIIGKAVLKTITE